jgi:hypothetical protein
VGSSAFVVDAAEAVDADLGDGDAVQDPSEPPRNRDAAVRGVEVDQMPVPVPGAVGLERASMHHLVPPYPTVGLQQLLPAAL